MAKKKKVKKEESINALSSAQTLGIALTVIAVIGLWFLNWYLLGNKTKDLGLGERGTFGDMFGAVNALFSGLAFAGIIWTILLQRNELRLQREETRQSRQEAMEQNKILRLQRFENTFFSMLNLQNEIVKNMQIDESKGRRVMSDAASRLSEQFSYRYLKFQFNQFPDQRNAGDDPIVNCKMVLEEISDKH